MGARLSRIFDGGRGAGQQLANLEVGGTKGKVLTTSVAQIHVDFCSAVASVKDGDYDVMDLDAATAFESDFQAFRCVPTAVPVPANRD